jgi:hypothetical protein
MSGRGRATRMRMREIPHRGPLRSYFEVGAARARRPPVLAFSAESVDVPSAYAPSLELPTCEVRNSGALILQPLSPKQESQAEIN